MSTEHRAPQWRSVDEILDTPEGLAYAARAGAVEGEGESPLEWAAGVDRRRFMELIGASLGLAGLTACTKTPEKIVPYVRAPEEIIPGKPLFFATAVPVDGSGLVAPVLAESHLGRPTKLEGNPEHPASMGATDHFTQAAVLQLYDPDRSQVVSRLGMISTWDAFVEAVLKELPSWRARKGAGLRILTEGVTSPTLAWQMEKLLQAMPEARWHTYEPSTSDGTRAGAKLAFGTDATVHYKLDKAKVLLTIDADVLGCHPGSLRYARDFMSQRKAVLGMLSDAEMARLYAIECTPTITGGVADHRRAMRPSEVLAFARSLYDAISGKSPGDPWIAALASDLVAHKGASAVIAGPFLPAAVHALALLINDRLANLGSTVVAVPPVEVGPRDHLASIQDLAADMKGGKVEALFIVGGNPVFDAPADLDFAQALDKVPFTVHLGLYSDETAMHTRWHVPAAHPLETWSDARAYDGTVTITQPLIEPLYAGRSAHEMLAVLAGESRKKARDLVRAYWQGVRRENDLDFDRFFRTALHDGFVLGSAPAPLSGLTVRAEILDQLPAPPAAGEGLELVLRPDPTIGDGRWANNGWLQELPKQVTKLTWDNAAMISPRTAAQLHAENEDVVELTAGGRKLRAPVFVLPGQTDGVVTLHFGHGRSRAGKVGTQIGVDVYPIRTVSAFWSAPGLTAKVTGETYDLAMAQTHHSMEGRNLVRWATLERFKKEPDFPREEPHFPQAKQAGRLTLYPDFASAPHAWGMSIDLGACTGCSACVVACQAENNIPIVGKPGVLKGREMHWLRIDRYYEGPPSDPMTHMQPIPCMQCENAPCELVCPVGATVHSAEGLNDMVYNRCLGTRYCQNNCPYHVRRFNFFQYQNFTPTIMDFVHNPDVTVRSRGVMEKCTYCVQRLNHARIEAKKQDRLVKDGEVETACQAVCPTRAISFGNIHDAAANVTHQKADPLSYGLLVDLNTRPRTTYVAKVTNPNPELTARPDTTSGGGHGGGPHGGGGHQP